MDTATPVTDAFVPLHVTTPDGVNWLEVVADADIYSHYKRLPQVVEYHGKLYNKTSFNSDSFIIVYREVEKKTVAFPA